MKQFLLQPFTDINTKKSSSGDSLQELDGLRGIAVIIVLLSHTASFGMYGQGSIGVLMFFFLSGFVLTLPFVNHQDKIRSFRYLTAFFLNRLLRIVPIYWTALIILHILFKTEFSWVLWNASFIKGWNHFWSIAQEARFYLLFPFLMLFLSFIKNRFFQIAFLLMLIVLFYEYRREHRIDMMDGRHVDFYFWMFLGGVLVCFVSNWAVKVGIFKSKYIAGLLGGISIFVLLFLFLSSTHYVNIFWRPLLPALPDNFSMNGWHMPDVWFVLFFILFLSATLLKNNLLNRILSLPILRHFGLLSYSMYLFHMHIMFVFANKGFKHEGLFIVVLACSYIVAYVSYILIEKPFLKLKMQSG